MNTLVEVKNLKKSFANFHAVRGLSFAVNRGEILGFLGPNGAGKTTTMRMIMGYLSPSSGEVLVFGQPMRKSAAALRAKIGYLPEGGPLYDEMQVGEFLRFIGQIRGMEKKYLVKRLQFVAKTLSLKPVWYKTIGELSKGYKRRTALGQAILHDPELLILDEPTDGLDPNQAVEVKELITSMAREKAIILSTHILEEVEALAPRTVIISQGKIVIDETTSAVAGHAPSAGTVVLETGSPLEDKHLKKIRALPEVKSLKQREQRITLVAKKDKNSAMKAALLAYCKSQNIELEALYSHKGGLREAFTALTKQKGKH